MTSPSPAGSSVPTASAPTASFSHRGGRAAALCVFLLGIGLLGVVFALAYELLRAPVSGLGLTLPPGTAAPPPAATIGASLAQFARQLLLLLLMTIAGSAIAGKGIGLYLSCAEKV